MTIHVVGTINGLVNEGMRNVATHLSREFEKEHTVLYSGLKEIPSILAKSKKSDVTLIFARANRAVYLLARLIQTASRETWIVLVQKPDRDFLSLCRRSPLKCGYLSITESDMEGLPLSPGKRKAVFPVGIRKEKFTPVTAEKAGELKQKYGFDPELPLVVHVGHCSSGRGLEDFLRLEGCERMIVVSGMFEDAALSERLEKAGVRLHKGFLEHVEEIYQMADAYLFPTRSGEFVISIPLSVMEALSCGLPVIAYRSFQNLAEIRAEEGGILRIDSADELNEAVKQAGRKDHTLLPDACSWAESAEAVMNVLKGAQR